MMVCVNRDDGHILGITLTLRTLGSEYVIVRNLKTLGNLGSSNCKPYLIPDDTQAEYIEVTYSDYIDSLVIKMTDDYYSFWGNKRSDVQTKTKRWEFDTDWQPIGISGLMDDDGVLALAPITYSM